MTGGIVGVGSRSCQYRKLPFPQFYAVIYDFLLSPGFLFQIVQILRRAAFYDLDQCLPGPPWIASGIWRMTGLQARQGFFRTGGNADTADWQVTV